MAHQIEHPYSSTEPSTTEARKFKRETIRKNATDQHRIAELARALTALKANTAELLQRKKQLQQLNRWFEVALNNMGRGLSMFDGW